MMKVAVPVLFALSLCGCTTAKLTDYTVRGLSNSQLCANWGSSSAAQRVSSNGKLIWAEIKARHLFSDAVSEEIYMQRLAIGMPEIAVVCALGPPTEINRTVTASGTNIQWVYSTYLGRSVGSSHRYVYTENGVITAFQD